jgi:hypothetical protein
MASWIPDIKDPFRVWRQFPHVMALVLFISGTLVAEVHNIISDTYRELMMKLLFTSVVLVPLWIGAQLRARYWGMKNITGAAGMYFFSLFWGAMVFMRVQLYTSLADDIFIWIMALSTHALAVILPLTKFPNANMEDFWQLNKVMFLRFLQSAFYSLFLSTGLVIAILSVEHLLGVSVNTKVYGDTYILIGILFNTWFFLSGLPQKWQSENNVISYPKALRVFVQYVLLPLISVYMIILYLYVGKILILQEWPLTWVAYLILSFSISGILAILLIWPLRNQESFPWVRTFSQWYFIALLPLSVLLLFSIGKQIVMYGITPNRYLLAMLSLWLPLISMYSFITRLRNILIFPVSLFLLCVISAPLPYFNAFDVSLRNQKSKLDTRLNSLNLLDNDAKLLSAHHLTDTTLQEVKEGFEFMHKWGYYNTLKSYIHIEKVDSLYSKCKDDTLRDIRYRPCEVELLTLIYAYIPNVYYPKSYEEAYASVSLFPDGNERDVKGFSEMQKLKLTLPSNSSEPIMQCSNIDVHFNNISNSFEFKSGTHVLHTHALDAEINSWILQIDADNNSDFYLPDTLLSLSGTVQSLKYKCYFNSVHLVRKSNNAWTIVNMEGDWLWVNE